MGQLQNSLISFSNNDHWHKYDNTFNIQMLKNSNLRKQEPPKDWSINRNLKAREKMEGRRRTSWS